MDNIFPFLWVTGSDCNYVSEIEAIKNAGIDAFIIESRIHPDFCGEGFWKDCDVIIKAAKELNMRVWFLDDKAYPTGFANGKASLYKNAKPLHVVCDNFVAVSDGEVMQFKAGADGDSLIAALAFPYENDEPVLEKYIDISKDLKGKWFLPVLPKGIYRIACVYSSFRGAEKPDYIDPLNPDSVDVLINEVYEKIYERYKDDFGNTVAGFFSDEPRLCDGFTSTKFAYGAGALNHKLGLLGAAYPYSDELFNKISSLYPEFTKKDFVALWYDTPDYKEIRSAFMSAVTDLYAENFSQRIGKWCKNHNVFYAGHIIEDMNAHTKSGCSVGHYFKSQSGQNLAGIDVVLHQIRPYSINVDNISYACGYANQNFFSYTMPMLAVSDAFLCRDKSGSLCEIFGAYGWGESISDMKWMADVMLSAGIDHFVPHAFCPETDSKDCPPHFYKGGKNPLYRPFIALISYMKTVLKHTDKKFRPKVGVLYQAESDWAGCNINIDGICRILSNKHVPFMIVPQEKILSSEIEVLIVADGTYTPIWVKTAINTARQNGIAVVNSIDADTTDFSKYIPYVKYIKSDENVKVLYARNIMFFQMEDGISEIETQESGDYCLFDVMNGIKTPVNKIFTLNLKAGETRLLIKEKCENYTLIRTDLITDRYNVYYLKNGNFIQLGANTKPMPVNMLIPDYSGTIKYETQIDVLEGGAYQLEFDKIGGSLELVINDKSYGFRFCNNAKYRIELEKGKHELQFLFYNTLANTEQDVLSSFYNLDFFGLTKSPVLYKLK